MAAKKPKAPKHPSAPEKKLRAAMSSVLKSGTVDKSDFEPFAIETAESAREQVARILGLDVNDFDPDMDAEIDEMIGNLNDIATASLEDIEDLLDEEPDDVKERLDGIFGKAALYASMAFTYGFAKFNKVAQSDAGVDRYTWSSLHDDKVRDAHEHLDGIEFDWDDPPLGAAESSSGDDCHPGDDYNCRCTAAPVVSAAVDEETATDVGDEDVPDEVDQAA